MRILGKFIFWLCWGLSTIMITLGVTGGIMYLCDKLNQYGTIMIGG